MQDEKIPTWLQRRNNLAIAEANLQVETDKKSPNKSQNRCFHRFDDYPSAMNNKFEHTKFEWGAGEGKEEEIPKICWLKFMEQPLHNEAYFSASCPKWHTQNE